VTDQTETQPDPVEERVAIRLAAADWGSETDATREWSRRTPEYKRGYLTEARSLIAIVRDAAPAVPAEQAPDTGPRQPAYDAVYAYIGSTNRVPGDLVTRNAMIWRAVHAALDAVLPAPAECKQCGDAGACNGGPCPLAPAAVSAVPGQADNELLPDRLEAVLTERFTELGNRFSEMRRHEQGADGWPASHPVGPRHVAEVLRELLDAGARQPKEA
jgi:hypothetical protein